MFKIPKQVEFTHIAVIQTAGELKWLVANPLDYHLTLQFIGRDVSARRLASVIVAAFALVTADDWAPVTLRFTGRFLALKTFKNHSIVAEVENGPVLQSVRKRLRDRLAEMDVNPKDDFGDHPHVTIARAPIEAKPLEPPRPIGPFMIACDELSVKYGPHRMTV